METAWPSGRVGGVAAPSLAPMWAAKILCSPCLHSRGNHISSSCTRQMMTLSSYSAHPATLYKPQPSLGTLFLGQLAALRVTPSGVWGTVSVGVNTVAHVQSLRLCLRFFLYSWTAGVQLGGFCEHSAPVPLKLRLIRAAGPGLAPCFFQNPLGWPVLSPCTSEPPAVCWTPFWLAACHSLPLQVEFRGGGRLARAGRGEQ